MHSKVTSNLNWGRNTKIFSKVFFPKNINEIKVFAKKHNLIFSGNNRSFGDNSINPKLIVSTKNLNKILDYDKKSGLINVESGILLSEILKIIIADGWILPLMPGSKYVSVGGIIANNVHGKNSKKNQLKYYVNEIKVLLESGKIITCSKSKNKKIFEMTIGGFGLTGAILSAKIKLKKIKSSMISQQIISFDNYKTFFEIIKKIKNNEYSVIWISSLEKNKISGLLYLGNHYNDKKFNKLTTYSGDKKLNLFNFFILKIFTQNYYLIKILNNFYFFYKKFFFKKKVHWNPFFFPQDKFTNFNKIYGKDGFIQFQFCVSEKRLIETLNEISLFFEKNKLHSSFVILKKFDEKGKYLNFHGKGMSVSMDIPINKNYKNLKFFLNNLVIKRKIRINFSKDSLATHSYTKNINGYKQFRKELHKINKKRKLNSLFSQRSKL